MGVIMMRFIREIPESRIVQKEINNLEQFGFTLVWKLDSVEVYAEVAGTSLHYDDVRLAA